MVNTAGIIFRITLCVDTAIYFFRMLFKYNVWTVIATFNFIIANIIPSVVGVAILGPRILQNSFSLQQNGCLNLDTPLLMVFPLKIREKAKEFTIRIRE